MGCAQSKEATIRNLIEACDPGAFALIGEHCDKYVWKYGAVSEVMLRSPIMWLGIAGDSCIDSHPFV